MNKTFATAAALLAATATFAQSSPATHSIRVLTPEAAQKAVNAAMAECRKQGFQVAVQRRQGRAQVVRHTGHHLAVVGHLALLAFGL